MRRRCGAGWPPSCPFPLPTALTTSGAYGHCTEGFFETVFPVDCPKGDVPALPAREAPFLRRYCLLRPGPRRGVVFCPLFPPPRPGPSSRGQPSGPAGEVCQLNRPWGRGAEPARPARGQRHPRPPLAAQGPGRRAERGGGQRGAALCATCFGGRGGSAGPSRQWRASRPRHVPPPPPNRRRPYLSGPDSNGRRVRRVRLAVSVETARPGRVHGAEARRPRALPRHPAGECPVPAFVPCVALPRLRGASVPDGGSLESPGYRPAALRQSGRLRLPRRPGLCGLRAECRQPGRALGLSRAAGARWGHGGTVPNRRPGVGAPPPKLSLCGAAGPMRAAGVAAAEPWRTELYSSHLLS